MGAGKGKSKRTRTVLAREHIVYLDSTTWDEWARGLDMVAISDYYLGKDANSRSFALTDEENEFMLREIFSDILESRTIYTDPPLEAKDFEIAFKGMTRFPAALEYAITYSPDGRKPGILYDLSIPAGRVAPYVWMSQVREMLPALREAMIQVLRS